MTLLHFALSALITGLTVMAASADEKPPAQRYQACLSEVEKFPKNAFEDAIQWGREGGGGPAEHCAASALMALGLYADAAKRLEALAQSEKKGPRLKAGILAQAGQAWLLADNATRAEAVATTALQLMPKAPALLIARARARAERGDYAGAKADLDIALMGAPGIRTHWHLGPQRPGFWTRQRPHAPTRMRRWSAIPPTQRPCWNAAS